MDDAARARDFQDRSRRLREQGRRLKARAEATPPGVMRDMLLGQAAILTQGADDLETQALALSPPVGTA